MGRNSQLIKTTRAKCPSGMYLSSLLHREASIYKEQGRENIVKAELERGRGQTVQALVGLRKLWLLLGVK